MKFFASTIALLLCSSSYSFHPASTSFCAKVPGSAHASRQLKLNSVSLSTLDTFYQSQPYIASFLTCALKGSAADALAQKQSNHQETGNSENANQGLTLPTSEEHLDLIRNLAFVLYGGSYQGMGQTFLYTHVYPALFGSDVTVTSVLAKAGMENFILAPFFCLPCVYTIKSLLEGAGATAGLEKYWDHIFSQQILIKYWSLWGPVQIFNFAVVPEHLRVPFSAIVSFFWVCILSGISSKEKASGPPTSYTAMVPIVSSPLRSDPLPVIATTRCRA